MSLHRLVWNLTTQMTIKIEAITISIWHHFWSNFFFFRHWFFSYRNIFGTLLQKFMVLHTNIIFNFYIVIRVWFQNKRCKDKKIQNRLLEKQIQRESVSTFLYLIIFVCFLVFPSFDYVGIHRIIPEYPISHRLYTI